MTTTFPGDTGIDAQEPDTHERFDSPQHLVLECQLLRRWVKPSTEKYSPLELFGFRSTTIVQFLECLLHRRASHVGPIGRQRRRLSSLIFSNQILHPSISLQPPACHLLRINQTDGLKMYSDSTSLYVNSARMIKNITRQIQP